MNHLVENSIFFSFLFLRASLDRDRSNTAELVFKITLSPRSQIKPQIWAQERNKKGEVYR